MTKSLANNNFRRSPRRKKKVRADWDTYIYIYVYQLRIYNIYIYISYIHVSCVCVRHTVVNTLMLPLIQKHQGKGSLGSLCVLVLWTPRRLGTWNIFVIKVVVGDDKMVWFSMFFFVCISWPVFLPYIFFAIHDLDFSMLVIMCIYIYIFMYLKYDFYIDDFFFRMSSFVSELCIRSNLRWYLDIGWVDLYVENGSIWKVRILLGDTSIFDWTMIMERRLPGTTFFFCLVA